MTPLDKTLRRALHIDGVDYVVTLTPEALKLTRKGRRLGMELRWVDITSGETALAVALQASVGRFDPTAQSKQGKARHGLEATDGEKLAAPRPRNSRRALLPKRSPRKKGSRLPKCSPR